MHFRVADANTSDSRTHIETWEALRTVAGRADFLYNETDDRAVSEHVLGAGTRRLFSSLVFGAFHPIIERVDLPDNGNQLLSIRCQ